MFDVGHGHYFNHFPNKVASERKEFIITDLKSTTTELCDTPAQRQLLLACRSFRCLHVCACVPCCPRIALCVHSPVLPGGPLKLDSLLSGLSSLKAHLEMRFKTAINIEKCWGGRSDYKTVLLEVSPTHDWAFGKKANRKT